MMRDDMTTIDIDVEGDALTAGESMLVRWLAAGRTNAQIGQCLGRSEKTVRNQLTRVYAKLGAANRAEAVALFLRGEWRGELR
jgi:DNA-binding CsgD family transcriptional regulator